VLHSDAGVPLTAQTAPEGGLYEWSAGKPAGEALTLVSVLPGGGPEWQSYLGSLAHQVGAGGDGEDARNAISTDGSRVFWTSEANTLYMRDVARGVTIQIGVTGLGGEEGHFQIAAADGSRVFWSESGGLYECEIPEAPACTPTRLGEAPAGGGSVIGASEDGSYVYWAAADHDLLVDHLQSGVWHLRQVATLSSDDAPDSANESKSLAQLSGRVSPDGVWLAFMSDRSLTGYDNLDAHSGQPDEEVFLYDAETQQLTCASCNPTGARPTGVEYGEEGHGLSLVGGNGYEGWAKSAWLSGFLPGWVSFEHVDGGVARVEPRFLSDSGRLFFDSDDGLVSSDGDGTWDVYEFEPVGVGGCVEGLSSSGVVFRPEREAGGVVEGAGCVGLVSGGESSQESVLLDASVSGGDVFFLTTQRLSSADSDGAFDVYDAHECTVGSPCVLPAGGSAGECVSAEACRVAAATGEPSVFGAPLSSTFSGSGNPPLVKVETRAQKLARALKACKRDRRKAKRVACEKQARKKYGAKPKAKAKKTAKRATEKSVRKSAVKMSGGGR
jgi:hypothetical protein